MKNIYFIRRFGVIFSCFLGDCFEAFAICKETRRLYSFFAWLCARSWQTLRIFGVHHLNTTHQYKGIRTLPSWYEAWHSTAFP